MTEIHGLLLGSRVAAF